MKGVIAAGDRLTAGAGARMLRSGGNAVDAAVAAAFASFVAEIGVVQLGGSGVAQIYQPAINGKPASSSTYDFFSAMPGLGASGDSGDLDFERVIVDFGPTTQEFYLGRGSAAVPGNIYGLCLLSEQLGQLPLQTLLEPAIHLAEKGLPIAQFQADTCELLYPIYTHTPEMRDVFEKNGRIIQPGDHFAIPGLAKTLRELAHTGVEYIRSGTLAEAIIKDQAQNGGLLTRRDMREYEVKLIEPIRINYRQFEVLLPPPSSSGGVLTALSLRLLGEFDIREVRPGSSQHLRLLAEVMAATTRARVLWEEWAATLPVDRALGQFLNEDVYLHYVNEVRNALESSAPTSEAGEFASHSNTSHISVVDGEGMAVSLTTTAGESAGYIVPDTGFIPNNILGEADLHPGGFHNHSPGERISTMMTPTIVLLNDQIKIVVGSGGSIRIRSAILQVLNNFLDFDMSLHEAVNSPRVHLENGVLQCEYGIDQGAMDDLEKSGYRVNRWDKRSIYFGGAHSVAIERDERLVAAGDSRRGGAVEVVD